MLKMVTNISRLLRKYRFKHWKFYSTRVIQNVNIDKIRNIGILAHIDAGKTTTTERMLYYAGLIQEMGEVHHGNTVTDWMDQERERGITITSAAVTFYWKRNQFNLIDTPGHIDFTMEVEQTLNVLDGAVVILDGSAGVEAQTLMVWRQADRYNLPRIIYVNKMDRKDADIKMCCSSVEKKLEVMPLLLQLPLVENGSLNGIVDIISMEILKYIGKERNVSKIPLTETSHPKSWNEVMQERSKLVEMLADFDDDFANKVIAAESFDSINNVDVYKALGNITSKKAAIPVVLGSSYKNIGVQSLMDAILLYLPSPVSTNKQFSTFEDTFCGKAFKVRHDRQKGPLVFVRVYNGVLKKGQRIYNVQKEISEELGRVYVAYADNFDEVLTVEPGNIAVVAGLKKTTSGDLLTTSTSAAQKARKKVPKTQKSESEEEETLSTSFGTEVQIPQPVFFCSIEPASMASQSALEKVLLELQREDPSLRVNFDEETGQTVLGGMGELHLEIIKDRILKEHKLDVDLGPLQIAYRESPIFKVSNTLVNESKIANSKQFVKLTLSLTPVESGEPKDILKYDKSPENASHIASIFPKHLAAMKQGILVGLAHGPKISSQVMNTEIILHWLEVGKGTSDTYVSATATQLIKKLLGQSETNILEPVMQLEIVSPAEHLSAILFDLSRRRSVLGEIGVRGNTRVVTATAPLAELMGYSTELRTLASGNATFTAEFLEYQKMSTADEAQAIQRVRGF